MLWLILAIILLIIAIAGGAIVHPILFAIAIVAGLAVLVVHLVIPSAFNPVHYVQQVKK